MKLTRPRAVPLQGPIARCLLLLLLASCAGRVPTNKGVAEPFGRDFLDATESYRGKVVRLPGVEALRVQIGRPLVFTLPGSGEGEVVVNDARSLARVENLRPGELVTILFECTEGKTDRGNLLVDVERSGAPSAVDPQRK